ncbi:MAG: protein kinase [Myxococcales bacterium]|nr:protein kinase [Myxococcales bacterium]
MTASADLAATIDAALATLAAEGALVDLATVARRTIAPPVSVRPERLDPLRTEDRLVLGRTLGEGGMGVVRLAEQRMLHREVAVKTLKQDVADDATVRKLLQEAWITGALEHPNIVPVHDLGVDAQGVPFLVLKKIEGEVWGELLAAPERVERRLAGEGIRAPTEDDVLDWHLRVLGQVCRALAYAHSRGIVHRDLKPENIMVGAFGEVYVLDWGIAVSLEDDGSGRLPLVKNATAIAGTPAYMAPEQLGGDVPRISARTDVYLVGAMLHELLTGRVPHEGDTLRELLATLFTPVELPEGVPDELARIVRRAMDPDPDGRFENVDQIRLALEAFSRHVGARRLAAKGERLHEKLDEAQREGADAAAEAIFAEARFAYRAALEAWPESEEAREGLDAIVAARAARLLDVGDLAGARRLLANLERLPPALVAKVEEAEREAELVSRRAEALRRDADTFKGRNTRRLFLAVLGTTWVASPFVAAAYGDLDAASPRVTLVFTLGSLALVTTLVVWARESMLGTRLNRTIVGMLFTLLAMQVVLSGVGSLLEMSMLDYRVILLFFHASMAAAACVAVNVWFVPCAIGYTAAVFVAAWSPEHSLHCMGVANAFFVVNAVAVDAMMDRECVRAGEDTAPSAS